MPNGDPNWGETELPKLERFFKPLAEEIEKFANDHNLIIDRYYHQGRVWSLRFAHPQGGDAALEIYMHDDDHFRIGESWCIDDYDTSTRSTRYSLSQPIRRGEHSLTPLLRQSLLEILSWQPGEWTKVSGDYQGIWHQYTRAEFEAMRRQLPQVRWQANDLGRE